LGGYLDHRAQSGLSRRGALIAGIATNLGLIGYFKYTNFFVDTLAAVRGQSFSVPPIVLPLAISFFTFQQIAYLVDAANGQSRDRNFLHYALFVSFFPQLIAGPIVHHQEVIPQLRDKTLFRPQWRHLSIGITIFALGLSKKVLLADTVAPYANEIFDAAANGEAISALEAWTGALAYTFQLYFDFSGYSDMAIGAARLFGIKLPLNFNSPYKALSISDFWRRWHITLSNFLRDYLYIPLGGNRLGPPRQVSNLLMTMLLGGLWHGAGWTFVFWGGLHGVYLGIHRFWEQRVGRLAPTGWQILLYWGLTFGAVVVSWVFFRAPNFVTALTILQAMFGGQALLTRVHLSADFSIVALQLLALFAITMGFPNTQQWLQSFEPALNSAIPSIKPSQPPAWQWSPKLWTSAVMGILIFSAFKVMFEGTQSEFLYFNF
ncbi:MAG: MBOAT family O-acyltransferase, partial [Cyanobacteria bacterium P01_H01_bin.15]